MVDNKASKPGQTQRRLPGVKMRGISPGDRVQSKDGLTGVVTSIREADNGMHELEESSVRDKDLDLSKARVQAKPGSQAPSQGKPLALKVSRRSRDLGTIEVEITHLTEEYLQESSGWRPVGAKEFFILDGWEEVLSVIP